MSYIVICTLLNILYFLSASDVTVWSEDMSNIVFRLYVDGFSYREYVGNIINCFSWAMGSQCFKWNFAEISAKFQVLDLLNLGYMIGRVGFSFFKRAKIPNALQAFGWVSGNWDSFKSTRQLPRVDFLGQDVTDIIHHSLLGS